MSASEREQRSRSEPDEVIWQDVECGSYAADLALWEELASRRGGPVLELGAGSGRVSLHLARRGHELTAVEANPELAASLQRRARSERLPVQVEVADARALALGRAFALVLAPMQLLQILGRDWRRCVASIAGHLDRNGVAAVALLAELPPPIDAGPPLPDVLERDGWVYSSLPLGVERGDSTLIVRRLRQRVSPEGELTEEEDETRLQLLDLDAIEDEARVNGLRRAERREIAATEAHVGSTVLVLERA
jgi:SAM-dependent methyltransferase